MEPDRGAVLLQQRREPGHQVEQLGGHGLAGHSAAGDRAVGVLGGVPPQPLAEAALGGDPAGRGGVGGPAAEEQPQPGGRVVLRLGEQVEQGGGPVVGRRVSGERAERRVEQPVRHGLAAGGGEHLAQHPRLLVGAETGRTRGIPDPAGQIGGELARRRRPDGQQPHELAVCVARFEHLGQPGRGAAEFGGGKRAEPGEQLKVRPLPVGVDGQPVGPLRSARVRVRAGGGTAVRLQHPVPDGVPEPRQMGGRQPPGQAPRIVHEPPGLLPGPVPAAVRLLQHITGIGLGAGDPGARPVDVRLGDAVIGRERNGSSGAAGHVYESGRRH
ncbi:hypothetical protein [Streptomyces atratus]|uniref:hypothetical protein n=1 Tax=Streptomyces atratus TaxID=1893 RepID=UPI000931B5C5|nr:hypothetical protein [Streptomyces atratus]